MTLNRTGMGTASPSATASPFDSEVSAAKVPRTDSGTMERTYSWSSGLDMRRQI